jgi:hypothetical protein
VGHHGRASGGGGGGHARLRRGQAQLNAALLAGLLGLAAPAAAGWRSVPASEPGACGADLFVFSADGWHYACAQKGGGPDVLVRNGVPIATLKPSQLSGSFGTESKMSDNWRVILHQLAAMDAQGTVTGVMAAVNGAPFGKVYQDISLLALEGGGADLAVVAQAADGWHVVTAAATSAPLPVMPMVVGLGVNGRVAYTVAPPQGAMTLYVDHKPVRAEDLYAAAVSPDLKRRITVHSSPEREGVTVEPGAGAKTEGPFMGAGSFTFAPDGRRYAYTARRNPQQYDTVVLNGARYDCAEPRPVGSGPLYSEYVLFSPSGSALWVCGGKLLTLYFEGKKVLSFSGQELRGAFTPAGKPGLLLVKDGQGAVISAKGIAIGLPRPLTGARLGFDAEDEFHYYARVDGQVALVCAAFGDKDPRACMKKARSLYRGAR